MKENIVALNIFTNNEIRNTNGFPLIYYWDKEVDIIEDLKENESLKLWLLNKQITKQTNLYFNTVLRAVIYDGDDYVSKTIALIDIYGFDSNVGKLFETVAKDMLTSIFYKIRNERVTPEQIVNFKETYRELYEYALTFVSKETYNLYIKSYLQETYQYFNEEHIRKVAQYIQTI